MVSVRRIEASGPVEIVFRNGTRVLVTPPGAPAKKGRPATPATLRLRERLQADRAAGSLKALQDYVAVYLREDPGRSKASAYQTVRREVLALGLRLRKAKA